MRDSLVAFLACTWPLLAQWLDLRTMRDERKNAEKERDDAVKLSDYIEGELAIAKRRNAYLEERNAQLTFNALAKNIGRFITVNKN